MQKLRKMDKHRLAFFSDALIAIIMTILILDVKVPQVEYTNDGDLWRQLVKQIPHLYGFAISFAMLFILWLSHHDLFQGLNEADRTIGTLNFFFVGTLAIIPFSTAFASEFPQSPLAVSTLAFNLFLMNIFLAGMWIYATKNKLLDPASFHPRYQKIKRKLGMSGGFVFLAAALVSRLSPAFALVMIALVPLLHTIPIQEK